MLVELLKKGLHKYIKLLLLLTQAGDGVSTFVTSGSFPDINVATKNRNLSQNKMLKWLSFPKPSTRPDLITDY